MKPRRRQIRSDPRVLTANTGEEIFDPEDAVASDIGFPTSQATTAPVVGRTTLDLLYERGLTAAAAKVLSGMDAMELLGTTAYVLLELFSRAGVFVMRFWVFLGLLAGYHVIVKPLGAYFGYLLSERAKRTQGS